MSRSHKIWTNIIMPVLFDNVLVVKEIGQRLLTYHVFISNPEKEYVSYVPAGARFSNKTNADIAVYWEEDFNAIYGVETKQDTVAQPGVVVPF